MKITTTRSCCGITFNRFSQFSKHLHSVHNIGYSYACIEERVSEESGPGWYTHVDTVDFVPDGGEKVRTTKIEHGERDDK